MSYDLVQVQPLRCINYFQITCATPRPLKYRHEEDYVKRRRKCTSPLVQIHKNTSDCFYKIYLYFSTLVWYTLIHFYLAVRIILVLMMFAHFMSSIHGSWLVEMRWCLNPGLWFKYNVNWSRCPQAIRGASEWLFFIFFSSVPLSWKTEKTVMFWTRETRKLSSAHLIHVRVFFIGVFSGSWIQSINWRDHELNLSVVCGVQRVYTKMWLTHWCISLSLYFALLLPFSVYPSFLTLVFPVSIAL